MGTIIGSQAFLWEFSGVAILIPLGNGACVATNLRTTRAANTGWLGIAFGWGLAAFAGTSIADASGGHLNPAVTVALVLDGTVGWNLVPYYVAGQLLGASVGAILAWVVSEQLFDANGTDDDGDPTNANAETGGNFFTAPLHPSNFWNAVTEFLATFVLLSFILFDLTRGEFGPLKCFSVSFIIVSIGLSLGSLIGYTINPACDLGLRLAYASVLPIKDKGDANWSYARVPIVTPVLAVVATGALALTI